MVVCQKFFFFVVQSEFVYNGRLKMFSLGDFLCLRTPDTGQLNPLFYTFAEMRPIVNRVVAWQTNDWLAANAKFSALCTDNYYTTIHGQN